jgi:hypothetical protein
MQTLKANKQKVEKFYCVMQLLFKEFGKSSQVAAKVAAQSSSEPLGGFMETKCS